MKCPYCKKEMEQGYIPFNSPLILKWISTSTKEKIRISDKVKWYEIAKIKDVFYCNDCNIFIKKN